MRSLGPVPERFEREYGCSVSEWMQWLPIAAGGNQLTVDAGDAANPAGGGPGGRARIELTQSPLQPLLVIAWQPLAPRKIALLAISRLHVRFEFSETTEFQRQEFMRHFDLTMQRGGG